jgi:hypothetical protein
MKRPCVQSASYPASISLPPGRSCSAHLATYRLGGSRRSAVSLPAASPRRWYLDVTSMRAGDPPELSDARVIRPHFRVDGMRAGLVSQGCASPLTRTRTLAVHSGSVRALSTTCFGARRIHVVRAAEYSSSRVLLVMARFERPAAGCLPPRSPKPAPRLYTSRFGSGKTPPPPRSGHSEPARRRGSEHAFPVLTPVRRASNRRGRSGDQLFAPTRSIPLPSRAALCRPTPTSWLPSGCLPLAELDLKPLSQARRTPSHCASPDRRACSPA